MDITSSFKASVLTAQLQNKPAPIPSAKSKSKSTRTHRNKFGEEAKCICLKITALRDVLLENRAAYMRIGQHLKGAAYMTDVQRDIIDRETEKCIAFYSRQLENIHAKWCNNKHDCQESTHIEAVIALIISYLQSVQHIHMEQKKFRAQYELETHKLLKLASDIKNIPERSASGVQREQARRQSVDGGTFTKQPAEQLDDDLNWEWGDDDPIDISLNLPQTSKVVELFKTSSSQLASGTPELDQKLSSSQVALDEDMERSRQEVESESELKSLTTEDVQLFEEENMQLYNELQGLADEVEQIEKNVVDIAQLQDLFTEKVSLQQQNIDRIISTVIGTTENVKDANEQIRQATQRNAGIRVWALMLLLIMSFTLLLLDWVYE